VVTGTVQGADVVDLNLMLKLIADEFGRDLSDAVADS